MTKDKALEELFLAHKPQFDDEVDFMAALNKRLDAVEYIKQHQEATLRRYKIAMVAAFIVGIISSSATITFLLNSSSLLLQYTDRLADVALRELTHDYSHRPCPLHEFRHHQRFQQCTGDSLHAIALKNGNPSQIIVQDRRHVPIK